MLMNEQAYKEIEAVVGPENITADPQICDTYSQFNFHRPDPEIWWCRPDAIVLPGSTEEVSAFVKICNKYQIKYKAHSTGYGAHNGATSPDMVLVDLRRMNHIVDIDEKNMVAVIEPYAVGGAIQAECWKRGLNVCITTAGPQSSVLASIAAHLGGSCASVSMGYNGRNMMACEWVAPNGDIIRIGSADSDAGWYSADGPGPSAKAFIRGFNGYDGALGIFTKAAVKLYHWAGPEDYTIANEGNLYEADVQVPENMHFYTLITKDFETTCNAYYKIAECEICYYMNKFSIGITGRGYMPEFFEEAVKYPHLREALKMGRHRTVMVVIGNSERDLAYKVDCLKKIAEEENGILIGGHAESPYAKVHLCSLCRADGYASLFNGPGSFHVAMGADEALDVVFKQAQYAQEIKERMIENGETIDDLGDGSYVAICGQQPIGHNEAVMMIDMDDEKSAGAMMKFSMETAKVLYEKALGGIGFAAFGGPDQIMMFNDKVYKYYSHIQRIKQSVDPDNLGAMTFV